MPIIFGWGRQTKKQIGVTFKILCNHCNNKEYWVLTKITSWFTLFFIPIIPYSIKYFLSCSICEYGLTLNSEQIEHIKPIAEINQLLIDGKITEVEYRVRMSQLNGESLTHAEAEVVEQKGLSDGNDNIVFCSKCGTKITEDIKFCGNCGAEVFKK